MEEHSNENVGGTLEFLAPERACLSKYDKRVDYFSIGIIFYILIGK